MMSRYTVGFLIPKDAERILGDDGWEFKSNSRLTSNIESVLETNLSICESSPDLSTYDGTGLKVDVFKDSCGKIENVYFRFYDDSVTALPDFLKGIVDFEVIEFFIPNLQSINGV